MLKDRFKPDEWALLEDFVAEHGYRMLRPEFVVALVAELAVLDCDFTVGDVEEFFEYVSDVVEARETTCH